MLTIPLLFDLTTKPCMYQRYVDDTFAIFKTKNNSELDYIRSILRNNIYPENIINISNSKKITQF